MNAYVNRIFQITFFLRSLNVECIRVLDRSCKKQHNRHKRQIAKHSGKVNFFRKISEKFQFFRGLRPLESVFRSSSSGVAVLVDFFYALLSSFHVYHACQNQKFFRPLSKNFWTNYVKNSYCWLACNRGADFSAAFSRRRKKNGNFLVEDCKVAKKQKNLSTLLKDALLSMCHTGEKRFSKWVSLVHDAKTFQEMSQNR